MKKKLIKIEETLRKNQKNNSTKKMVKLLTDDTANVERLVDAENYQIWKFQLNILFRSSELYEIVHNDTPEPDGTTHRKRRMPRRRN